MLQWRLAAEMMDTPDKLIVGNGLKSTQKKLNDVYIEKGIYTGNPELGDRGYLDYNFHNQFLESFVTTGIPGLLIILLIILDIFFVRHRKLLFPLHVYIVTLLFFFTESVLERQAGIVFFCLLVFTIKDQR